VKTKNKNSSLPESGFELSIIRFCHHAFSLFYEV
jgi:hypothetical protein